MRYLSVCSGIEAATVAWHPLGWEPVAFAEIEPYPSAVLAHHYPSVPNWSDLTRNKEWPDAKIDLLVGGTPCQGFSVAGLRGGLRDPRSRLAFDFLDVLDRYEPRWFVWENVPGVLSSGGGRDFGAFLGAVGELGYGFAYRVLDAQHFGVPQRRRRVFVVGHLGKWRPPAAVLFDAESLRGNPAPRRKAREDVAPTLASRARGGGGLGTDFDCDGGLIPRNVHTLRGEGFDASEDGTGRGTPLIPRIANPLTARMGKGINTTLDEGQTPLAFRKSKRAQTDQDDETWVEADATNTLNCFDQGDARATEVVVRPDTWKVRRLTPRECERLQGFPDDYTAIPYRGKPAADGPRYKALGNSMAVPCMRWIGKRIDMVEEMIA